MEEIPTTIAVVAVALLRAGGTVLMQRRRADQQYSGLWEFPGGKVEHGETEVAALLREIAEELGIAVAPADLTWLARAELPGERHVIALYTCLHWIGEPKCLDAAEIAWFAAEALADLPMPPLDRPLAEALKAAI